MSLCATRLEPGTELVSAIEEFVKTQAITAGVVVSAVGNLNQVCLRMAGAAPGQEDIRTYNDTFEIVSVTGTVGTSGSHIHLSVSDKNGKVTGGHLKEGCLVATTVELVIMNDEKLRFRRQYNASTNFNELVVSEEHHD